MDEYIIWRDQGETQIYINMKRNTSEGDSSSLACGPTADHPWAQCPKLFQQ